MGLGCCCIKGRKRWKYGRNVQRPWRSCGRRSKQPFMEIETNRAAKSLLNQRHLMHGEYFPSDVPSDSTYGQRAVAPPLSGSPKQLRAEGAATRQPGATPRVLGSSRLISPG